MSRPITWTAIARLRLTPPRKRVSSKTKPSLISLFSTPTIQLAARTKAQVFWFSRQKEVDQGAYVRDGKILVRDHDGQREIMQVSEIPLKGNHNVENVLAAVGVGVLMQCVPDRI